MSTTQRLYFTDSGLLDFSATVIAVESADAGDHIILDRTAFYPTGGGQPHDTGRLGDGEVLDVFESESGAIVHTVNQHGLLQPGQEVVGRIDPARRLDHMQQHSGQHILSQAFIQSCGAETRSFHLGVESSSIDIELDSPTDEHMRAAEGLANDIVFADRPMRVHLVDEQGAAQLPLRKESAITGEIRVIEIENFDWSPCGGTHASRTGQIGVIAIKSFERAKKLTRVQFVCGVRALADYRTTNGLATAIAQMFSAERSSAPTLVARALEENKALRKRIRDLMQLATTAEAAQLLSDAKESRGFKIVQAVFDNRDLEEIRLLAAKITQAEPAVALLATRDAEAARLVFGRSALLTQNMGKVLGESCQLLGGRGGGKPDLAQGGGPNVASLQDALDLAVERVTA